MVRDLLSLDMAMVATLDPMVDMDMEEAMGEVTVPMGEAIVAIAAMEVTMERERLDMVVMEAPMVVVMVLAMEGVMVDMEEDIEEDMVEDTGDDLSDIINSLSAFDFFNSCILSSPGFGCLLLNIRIKIVHS